MSSANQGAGSSQKAERDGFKKAVKENLAKLTGGKCSKCKKQTWIPNDDPAKITCIGEACHIAAASPGGPRYVDYPQMSSEERSSISNAIWLCCNCHVEVDNNPATYNAARLQQMKKFAESQELQNAPELTDQILLSKIASKAKDKWDLIAKCLNFSSSDIKSIKKEHMNDPMPCYMDVFDKWQKRTTPPYTWDTIIWVLKNPVVEEMELATEIEKWLESSQH